ncbi:hypothetical protein [Halorussus litoreus]|uniref:hypothetical protein n=1 Tax=Halorussus litoreus TaxID=1710536 RepID=UPI000E25522B|nr:hypothetical protein [Halorussus litoreus]
MRDNNVRNSIRILLAVTVVVSILSLSVAATAGNANAAECMSVNDAFSPDCGGDDDDGGGGGGGGCLCPVDLNENFDRFSVDAPQPV